MDHFGIGAAVYGAASVYFNAARRTGRTTSLIESLKDGDRIVFADGREAARVKRMCEYRGIKVECVTISDNHLGRAFLINPSKGRTLFDHTWLERFYLAHINEAQRLIDQFQENLSSQADSSKPSELARIEASKWGYGRS